MSNRDKVEVWNKGVTVGPKPPLTQRQLMSIRSKIAGSGNLRDLVLFSLAVESSLGAGSLVELRVKDIARNGVVLANVSMSSGQSGYPVQFDLSDETRQLIGQWIREKNLKSSSYLFSSRISGSPHISARQYARIVSDWIALIGLDPRGYSAQSLRRSKPMLIYARTNDVDAAQAQLGHARTRSTLRFLGIQR